MLNEAFDETSGDGKYSASKTTAPVASGTTQVVMASLDIYEEKTYPAVQSGNNLSFCLDRHNRY